MRTCVRACVCRVCSVMFGQVRDFYEQKISPLLSPKLQSYIIDFALARAKVWVIELNPFYETTDGCLFSWQRERSILENGPFEFRVNTAPKLGALKLVSDDWKQVIAAERAEWLAAHPS